ncbi:MAG: NAD(P)-binding domain-containing protein, partial [Bacteroidaceae bacterium]|nr:NAD(P)-binding domain-containing protein [Bacteroidaceae bacterium]
MNKSIAIIGAGNVATSLALSFADAGMPPVAVWSRSLVAARMLGSSVGCPSFTDIESMPDADIVIISVVDDALPEVARAVAARYSHSLVLHTAGSISMALLHAAGCNNYGVFYPMQTFSKGRSGINHRYELIDILLPLIFHIIKIIADPRQTMICIRCFSPDFFGHI